MECSRPRPSILSLFDPLSLTPGLDRAVSPDSDKENDFIDTPFVTLQHIHVPPRTLKRRLVDVGDVTVEHSDMNALLSNELGQGISYIVDDDENDTLTFRDMAKAATPKWSSRHATVLETPKVLSPRTPLVEISLKDESTPLARKKPYKTQPVSTTSKGSEPACLIFPPSVSSDNFSGFPTSHTEVPEVRVNDAQSSSESSFPHTLDRETLVTGTLPSSLSVPAPCLAQPRTRHLSPTSPPNNANRYSVDLQTSFQIHFPSHDTTFDLLKDKVSFFGSTNECDSFLNNLEVDSSLDDILTPELGPKIENNSGFSPTIILNQAQSVVKSDKRLMDHPQSSTKDIGVTEPSTASHTDVGRLSLVQPSISNQINTGTLIDDTEASLVQPRVFHPPLPLVADCSRPTFTPNYNPRHPPPQIHALRIVKRSKTVQQKPSKITKGGPPQDGLMPIGSRVPSIAEAPASLTMIKKDGPSEISQVRRTDKAHLPPSLASNGPRRVLISDGPKLNSAPNARVGEQGKLSSTCGPRRVAMVVPSTVVERTFSSARPPVQPSSGLRQPVKYGTSAVKPVQRTAGSRLPAITRRIGGSSGASGDILGSRRVT